ncbi:MAG: acetolactate decarboxylase [Methanosarcinales archaeon]|nr:acetolactate decarboxylase [Methanosarcinales archaeon]
MTFLCLLILAAFAVPPLASAQEPDERDVLFQVSTIDALLQSVYDGILSFADLKEHGDFGIGTFDGLDGELIALDGEYYQARSDGLAYPVDEAMTTPFSTVTFFEPDLEWSLNSTANSTEFFGALDALIPSSNLFYAIRMEGEFPYVKTRSYPRQSRPYRPLAELNQSVYEHRLVRGAIVGFYAPAFVKGVNVPGYHLHFITEDRTAGGHVLDFSQNGTEVQLDITSGFAMVLPTSGEFGGLDLTRDLGETLEEIEK